MSQQMLNTKMMQTLVDKLSLAGLDRQLKCIKRGHEGRGEGGGNHVCPLGADGLKEKNCVVDLMDDCFGLVAEQLCDVARRHHPAFVR